MIDLMKSPFSIMSSSVGSPKKDKLKKPRTKPSHPRTADMVNGAIKALKERGGSSLQAIKKYMTSTYKVDAEKQAPFIKRYLKTAVAGGSLVQTKGKGAAGSFKLAASDSGKSKRSITLKTAPLKKLVKTTAKKPVKKAGKKPVKKAAVVKAVAEKKKIIKGPAAKPPKVKTAVKVKAAKPKKSPKKTARAVKKTPIKRASAAGRKK